MTEGAGGSTEEQKRGDAADCDHVRVLCHEEHGELHGAVLGVISGDQFGFRLRQVKRDSIGFRVRRHQIYEERHELSLENVPARDEAPKCSALRIDDVTQTEATGHY